MLDFCINEYIIYYYIISIIFILYLFMHLTINCTLVPVPISTTPTYEN